MHQASLGNVVSYLVNTYNIPIGFEESSLDRGHEDYRFATLYPDQASKTVRRSDGTVEMSIDMRADYVAKVHKFDLRFHETKLSDVIDSLVGQMKYYDWQINDDVVNIFPIEGRDKRFEGMLKVHIRELSLPPTFRNGRIKWAILRLPSLLEFCNENSLRPRLIRDSGPSAEAVNKSLGTQLNLSDVTLRQALNKIARNKGGAWILRIHRGRSPSGDEYFDLEI
jgi:hypothetical protein